MKTNKRVKRFLSVFMSIMMVCSVINGTAFQVKATTIETPSWAETKLYFHTIGNNVTDKEAWAAMEQVLDVNTTPSLGSYSSGNSFRVYLPSSAKNSDGTYLVYNNYSSDITLGSTTIKAKSTGYVSTSVNSVKIGSGSQKSLTIYKSDAEENVFLNSNASTKAKEGWTISDSSGMVSALKLGKLQGSKSDCYITEPSITCTRADGTIDVSETAKQIKGRGNTTWTNTTKKSWNFNLNSKVSINGMAKGKKYSLLANFQEPSLSRNRFLYDLADSVGYNATDDRYADVYANGLYIGSYLLTQKNDSVVEGVETLEYNADGSVKDMDFMIELSAITQGDDFEIVPGTYGITKEGILSVVMPEEYDSSKKSAIKNFILSKYDKLFDQICNSNKDCTYESISKILDVESFAKAFLINELGKNYDGGVASFYLTYKDGKFYAEPAWDYDNSLGNYYTTSHGGATDYQQTSGWWLSIWKGNGQKYERNLLHRAYYNDVIMDVCRKVWFGTGIDDKTSFIYNINKFATDTTTDLKLGKNSGLQNKSYYLSVLKRSANNNFTKWYVTPNAWCSNHTYVKYYTVNYEKLYEYLDLDSFTCYTTDIGYKYEGRNYSQSGITSSNSSGGQYEYAADYLIGRCAWMSNQLVKKFTDSTVSAEKNVTYYLDMNGNSGTPQLNFSDSSLNTKMTQIGNSNIYKAIVKTSYKATGTSDTSKVLGVSTTLKSVTFDGETYGCKDKVINTTAIANGQVWMKADASLGGNKVIDTTSTKALVKGTTKRIYLNNNYVWKAPQIYYWGCADAITWSTSPAMKYLGDGFYYYDIPADATKVIFWDTASGDQSTDVTLGNVTALENNTYYISSRSGKKVVASLTDPIKAPSIIEYIDTMNMGVGGIGSVALTDYYGDKVSYTSSDDSIATVAEDGTVTGVGSGNVEITATVTGSKGDKDQVITKVVVGGNPDAIGTISYSSAVVKINVGKNGNISISKITGALEATADGYQITYAGNDGTSKFAYALEMTASADTSYKFVQWTKDGKMVSESEKLTLATAPNSDTTYAVTFAKDEGYVAPTEVPMEAITEFKFDNTEKTSGADLDEYAKENDTYVYNATSGTGTMEATITGDAKKHISWSSDAYKDEEGNTIGIVPAIGASKSNKWTENANVKISTSVVGYSDLKVSLQLGASKKGPANYLVSATDGNTIVALGTVSIKQNKTLYDATFDLPSSFNSLSSLGIIVSLKDTTAVNGSDLSEAPTGGEFVIQNVVISGKNTGGQAVVVTPDPNATPIPTVVPATAVPTVAPTKEPTAAPTEVPTNKITVYYKASSSWGKAYIHYRPVGGAWTVAPGVEMTVSSSKDDYNYKCVISIGTATSANVCFNNGSGSWDSRNGANYTVYLGTYGVKRGVTYQIAEAVATAIPTNTPTVAPTAVPTKEPTAVPATAEPTLAPTDEPTVAPTDIAETVAPTDPIGTQTPATEAPATQTPATQVPVTSAPTTLTPTEVPTNKVTVYYSSAWKKVYMHYKVDGGSWTVVPGATMEAVTDVEGYQWKCTVDLGNATGITCCFNNGTNWDSKNGANYTFSIGDFGVCNGITQKLQLGTSASLVSNQSAKVKPGTRVNFTATVRRETVATNTHSFVITNLANQESETVQVGYTENGVYTLAWDAQTEGSYDISFVVAGTDNTTATTRVNVKDGNTMVLYYNTSWSVANAHYKVDGGSWTTAPGVKMTASDNSEYKYMLTIDLGDATAAIVCFNNGSGSWDSKNGANYYVKGSKVGVKNASVVVIEE